MQTHFVPLLFPGKGAVKQLIPHQMSFLVCVGDVALYRQHRLVEAALEKARDWVVEVRLHPIQEMTLISVKLKQEEI